MDNKLKMGVLIHQFYLDQKNNSNRWYRDHESNESHKKGKLEEWYLLIN